MIKLYLITLILPIIALAQTPQKTEVINEEKVRIITHDEYLKMSSFMKSNFEKQIDVLKQDVDNRIKFLENRLFIYQTIFAILIAIISGGAFWGAREYVKKQMKKNITLALYAVDPTRWPIKIPAEEFEKERTLLESLGFRNLKRYHGLDDRCKNGITIYQVREEEDIKQLRSFIEEKNVNPQNAAYIIYAPNQRRDLSPLDGIANYVPSNFMGTLGNYIYVLARSINANLT